MCLAICDNSLAEHTQKTTHKRNIESLTARLSHGMITKHESLVMFSLGREYLVFFCYAAGRRMQW